MPLSPLPLKTRDYDEFWGYLADGSGLATHRGLAGGWAVLLSIICSAEEDIGNVLGQQQPGRESLLLLP